MAFVSTFYGVNIGGAEKSVEILYDGLKRLGTDVTIFTSRKNNNQDKGVITINNTFWLPNRLLLFGNGLIDLYLFIMLKSAIIKKGPFDVIHTHDLYALPACVKLAKRLSIPIVVTVRDNMPKQIFDSDYNRLYTLIAKIVLKARNKVWVKNLRDSDHVIAISSHIANELQRLKINDTSTIFNPSVIWNLKNKNFTNKKVFTIFSAGNLFKDKGFRTLIKAIPGIDKKVNAELIVAGEGPDRQSLEGLIKDLKLKNIRLIGRVPFAQVQDYYLAADIVAFPSIYSEPFGRIALEGMMAGKPIVASQVGGIPDIVEDGKTGILVRPNDSLGLTKALNKLLLNPKLMHSMGRLGRIRARALFAPTIIAQLHIDLYKKLTSRQP